MKRKRHVKKIRTSAKIVLTFLAIGICVLGIFIYDNKFKNKDDNKKEEKTNEVQEINDPKPNTKDPEPEPDPEPDKPITKSDSKYPPLEELDGEKKVIGKSSNGYTIYTKSGVTYVDGIMIVNKSYALPSDYYPTNTHTDASNVDNVCNGCINNTAYNAFEDMQSDAAALGLNIWIQSGYRPYSAQVSIYNRYVANDGQAAADTYSARPGNSEHQSGLCFDLNSISDEFGYTDEGKWVNDNAHLYGFIIRFPKGKDEYTGYKYESWHLRYVGSDLATKLYNNGDWISLEEYFGLTSEY